MDNQEPPLELPQWQKEALDIELQAIEANPGYLHKWDDVKHLLLA